MVAGQHQGRCRAATYQGDGDQDDQGQPERVTRWRDAGCPAGVSWPGTGRASIG
jgi:hypothetical protein